MSVGKTAEGADRDPPVPEKAEMIEERDRYSCRCCGANRIDPRVVERHRAIEHDLGRPVHVNSGYRCEKHNAAVGGSATSSHLRGLAWDVACTSGRERWDVLGAAIRAGVTRIGIGGAYLHLDIDRQKPGAIIWLDGH